MVHNQTAYGLIASFSSVLIQSLELFIVFGLSIYSRVSQTMGHDPKVGREALSSGSPKFSYKYLLFVIYLQTG